MWRRIAELAAGDLGRPDKEPTYVQLAWLEHALTRAFAAPFPGNLDEALDEVESVEDFAYALLSYNLPKGYCEADPGVNGGCMCEELRFAVQCWLAESDRATIRIHIRPNGLRARRWRVRLPALRTASLTFAQETQMYWSATETLESPLTPLSDRQMRESVILPMMRVWWERTQTLMGVDLPMGLDSAQRQTILDEILQRLEWWKKDVPDTMEEAKQAILAVVKDPKQRKTLFAVFKRVSMAMQFERTHHASLLGFEANVHSIHKDIARAWYKDTDGVARREAFLAAFLCYQTNPTIQYLQHQSHIIHQLQWVLHWDYNRPTLPPDKDGREEEQGAGQHTPQVRTLLLQSEEAPVDRVSRVCELTALTDLLTKRVQVLCLLDSAKWLASMQVMTDMLCLHFGMDVRGSIRMRRIISQWKWLFSNAVPAAYMCWFNPDVACILLDYLLQEDEPTGYTIYGLPVSTIAHRLLAFTAIYAVTNRALENDHTAHLDEVPPNRWQAIARGEYLPNEVEEQMMEDHERQDFNRMRCDRISEMIKRCEMADELATLSLQRLQSEYPILR